MSICIILILNNLWCCMTIVELEDTYFFLFMAAVFYKLTVGKCHLFIYDLRFYSSSQHVKAIFEQINVTDRFTKSHVCWTRYSQKVTKRCQNKKYILRSDRNLTLSAEYWQNKHLGCSALVPHTYRVHTSSPSMSQDALRGITLRM